MPDYNLAGNKCALLLPDSVRLHYSFPLFFSVFSLCRLFSSENAFQLPTIHFSITLYISPIRHALFAALARDLLFRRDSVFPFLVANGWYMLSGRISGSVPVLRIRNCETRIRSWHTTKPRLAICTVLALVFFFFSQYKFLLKPILIHEFQNLVVLQKLLLFFACQLSGFGLKQSSRFYCHA